MDCARAICSKMREPAFLDEGVDDPQRAIFDQVRAIHEDDSSVTLSCGGNSLNAFANGARSRVRTRRWRRFGLDKETLNRTEALPLCQRINFDFLEVEGLRIWVHEEVAGQKPA